MNKIFKTVWSDLRHTYVAVSEVTKTHGKKSGGSLVTPIRALLAAAVLTCGFFVSAPQALADEPAHASTNVHQYVVLSAGGDLNSVKSSPYIMVTDDNNIVYTNTNGTVYGSEDTNGQNTHNGGGTRTATTDTEGHSYDVISNGDTVYLRNGSTYTQYKFIQHRDGGVYTLALTDGNGNILTKKETNAQGQQIDVPQTTVTVYRYSKSTLETYNGTKFDPDNGSRIREDYTVTAAQGTKYTPVSQTDNVFTITYTGRADQKPTDILTKITSVTSLTGTQTNLKEELQTITADQYTSQASGGTTVNGAWDYVVIDPTDASGYRNLKNGGFLPGRFVTTDATNSKLTWNDATQQYMYDGTPVSTDNLYVIDQVNGNTKTPRIGVFTNADGSLYTGPVYGSGNEILLTSLSGNTYYSFWGAPSNDTTQTMSSYPLAKYNQNMTTLTDNDQKLAHNDIHHLKATASGDSVTFNAYRNGTNMNGDETDANKVPGSTIAVTAGGGTGGIANNGTNDRKLTVSEDGNTVTNLLLGSRVGVTNDISGNSRNATTQNLQSLTINGTTYGLQTNYAGDDNQTITKNLGETLNIKGGASSTSLATGNNIGVTKTDGNELRLSLNKDIDLSADGSVTTGNTKVNTSGLTINDGPSVLKSGINAGNLQITNVASGTTGNTWTPSNLPATGVTWNTNLNNGANIGDIYNTINNQIDVTGGSNITVTPTTSGLKTYQVNLNTHVTLGTNENQVDLNGENGTIRLGTNTSDKKVTFDGVNGQGSVAGINMGSLTVTPQVYTAEKYGNATTTTEGNQGATRIRYKYTAVNSPTVEGTAQTGNYVTGLDNKDWDWRALSVVSGRAATEDQVLKAGQHFFSIMPDENTTDLSTIPNYYNNGATAPASMAVGHGVTTNPTAEGSIAIGAAGTSTGRLSSSTSGTLASGGQYALAVGNDAHAEGNQSMAVGYQANAAGDYSIAIGNRNRANGIRSISLGVDTQAGYTSKVPTVDVTSDNYEAGTMQGGADIAIGNRSRVYGTGSTAIGFGAKVGKIDSNPAIGSQQTFSGDTDLAVAIGGRSLASTDGSVALGNLSEAKRDSGVVGYGYANKAASDTTKLIDANGNETTDATTKSGNMGTLRATYNDDNTEITKAGSTDNLKAGTAWQANMGAVSIGSDKRTGTVTDQDGKVTETYDLPVITRQLTGLAAGSEDTDAVNVAQLKATENKGMNFSGQNYQAGSATELQTIHKAQGETLNVRGATDNHVNPENTTDSNIYVTAGTGDNASLEIALNDDVKVHTVTAGTAGSVPTETNNSKAKAGKVTIVGLDGDQFVNYDITTGRSTHNELNGTTIGRISYTDNNGTAHEVATLDDGLKFKGDDASTTSTDNHVVRKLMDQDMSITGGADTTKLSDNNIGVVSTTNNDGLVIKLAQELNGITSIGNTTVNEGTPTGPKITFNTGDNAGTTISGGNVSVDGNKITNLKAGEDDTDAVNVSQLKETKAIAQKGWQAQAADGTDSTKTWTRSVTPTDDENNILKFAAGTDTYGDNLTVTGSGNTITVANKPNVNFQTVSVGGTEGTDGTYSGGIYLGPTIRNSTIIDNRENAPETKTDPNASENGAFITGLTNTQWTTGNYVSGRAATEDQLNTVAGQIRGEVSASDIYLSTVDVNYADNGTGTATATMSQSTATPTRISGLKNSYVNSVTVSTGEEGTPYAGKQLITITRNDDTVVNGEHTGQWVIPVTDLTKGLASTDWRLVGAEQTKTTGSGESATTTTTYDGSYTVKDGTVTLNIQDATNPSAAMQHVTLTGLNTVFAANNNATHDSKDSTVSLGSTIGINGRTLQGSETYIDTVNTPAVTDATGTFSTQNVSTKLDKDGNIVINLADNPQVKSLVLGDNNNNTTIVKKDGDHITYSYNTTDGDKVTNVTKTVANTDDGLNFTGDTQNVTVFRKLNSTLPITGYKDTTDPRSTTDTTGYQNITVNADDTNGLTLQLNKEVHVNTLRAGNTNATNSADKEGKIQIAGKKNNTDYEYTTITAGDGTHALDSDSTIARIKYKADSGVEHEVATLQDGYNLAGDTGTGKQALNGTLKISGGATTNLANANNIGVTASDDGWNLKLNQDLTGLNTVTAGKAVIGNQGSGTTHSLNYSNVAVAADGTRTTTIVENSAVPSGSYVTNLDNKTWTKNGSDPDGTGNIVSGRAATEDQLKAAVDQLSNDIHDHESSTYGLTADTTSDEGGNKTVTKTLGNNINLQGAVSKDSSGNDATLKTGEGADITEGEGENQTKKKVKNITTSRKDEDTIEISLADRIALNTALASTGSSISLYGANQSYNLGSAGTLNTHNAIQIDPDEGISLTHTDENGNVKKDGLRITGPTDYYRDNGNGTYTAVHQYDSNGSVGITNDTGAFTARMADMGGTGYLGLGNTMSTAGDAQKLNLTQLSTVTAATQDAIDAASTGIESANKKRDQWGQVAIMTDSKGNALYVTPSGTLTTDPNKAAKRSGHWYQNGVQQKDEAPNVPILAGSSTLRTDTYGNPVYKVDGRNQPMYETDADGKVVNGEDGNPKPLQNTVAGALVSARYGTASLNDTANARGKLESPYWQSNDDTTMTRLQYLDEGHFDPTTGSFDIGVVHEVATLDDGVKIKAAYDVGSQANDDGSRNALLNNTINLTGTFVAEVREQIEEKASTTTTPINLARSSNIAVATYDDPNGQEGTNVLFALQKDLKGFNTIQVGGTDDASNAANGSSTGSGTIRIGNLNDTTMADQPVTLSNASNLRSVSSNGQLQNVLYEAKDGSGNVYYTSDTSDSNVEKLYRKQGGGYTKNESESDGTGYYVGDDGQNRYVSFNGDYSDQKLTNDPDGKIAATKVYQVTKDGKTYYTTQQVDGATEVKTTLNRAEGRYMEGLSNTNWDGKADHIMSARAATEGQLQKAEQQVSTYSAYDGDNGIGGGFAVTAGDKQTVQRNLGQAVTIRGDGDITYASTPTGGWTGNIQTKAEDADDDGKLDTITTLMNKDIRIGTNNGGTVADDGSLYVGGVTITKKDSASGDPNGTAVSSVTGLGNTKWDANNITNGRAATEDQLKAVQNTITQYNENSGGFALTADYPSTGATSANTTVTQSLGQAIALHGTGNGTGQNVITRVSSTGKGIDIGLANDITLGTEDALDPTSGAVLTKGTKSSLTLNGPSGAKAALETTDEGSTALTLTSKTTTGTGETAAATTKTIATSGSGLTLTSKTTTGTGENAKTTTKSTELNESGLTVKASDADTTAGRSDITINQGNVSMGGNQISKVASGRGTGLWTTADTATTGGTPNLPKGITKDSDDYTKNNLNNAANIGDIYDIANSTATDIVNANKISVNGDEQNITVTPSSDNKTYTVAMKNDVTLGKNGEKGSLKLTDVSGNKTITADGADKKVTVGNETGKQVTLNGSDGTVSVGNYTYTDNGESTSSGIKIGNLNATVTTVTALKPVEEDGKYTGSVEATTSTKSGVNGIDYAGNMGIHVASGNTGTMWTKETADAWNKVKDNPWIEYNDSFNNAANIGDIYAIAKQVNNATAAAPASSGKNTDVHQLGNDKGGSYQVDLNDNLYLGGTYTKGDSNETSKYENPNLKIEGGDVDYKDGTTRNGIVLNVPQGSVGITGPIIAQQVTRTETINGKAQKVTEGLISAGGNQIHNVGSGFTGRSYQGRTPEETQVLNNAASIGDLYGVAGNVNNQINQIAGNVNRLSNRVNKVGAGAAALAALHPLDFDPDDKWDFAAGYGHYKDADAAAVGVYYRPNEDTMFSIGGSMGGGENMVNAGVSFKLGQGNHVSTSRVAMAKEIKSLRKEVEDLRSAMADMAAGRQLDPTKTKLFPDIPENHWAYEAISQLAGNGVVEGYPDGTFKGDRMMTRYEFAMLVYRAMQDGKNVSDRLFKEFEPELEYIRVDTVEKDKQGNPTIQRVRVIQRDNRTNAG